VNSKAYGKGKILPYLKTELSTVRNELFILGPWIDGYFVNEILTNLIDTSIHLKILLRYEEEESTLKENTLACLQMIQEKIPHFEARSLGSLHAKMILIDKNIAFLGSANWYRYSLEQAEEIVLKVELSDVKNLSQIVQSYWDEGTKIQLEPMPTPKKVETERTPPVPKAIDKEILDERARKALRENPKAFIIRR
jgi:phosphatidylserine/phosphatidylglycerophosphate/cardiolipin synthase-like enzyme